MAIPAKILNYLNKSKIKYDLAKHKIVYTAYDKAATLKVPEKTICKTLIVKTDKTYNLVLIPANKNLDKIKFKKILNNEQKKTGGKIAKTIDFATELWIKKNIKGIKLGAIPPFGKLWKLPVFIEKTLLKEREIVVNSGDHRWSIKIDLNNFKKAIPDLIAENFSQAKKIKKIKKAKPKKKIKIRPTTKAKKKL